MWIQHWKTEKDIDTLQIVDFLLTDSNVANDYDDELSKPS